MDSSLKPSEKYTLLIKEASEYFCISMKKMRRLAEKNEGDFSFYDGNRYHIIRPKFEEYLLKKAERKVNYEKCIGKRQGSAESDRND